MRKKYEFFFDGIIFQIILLFNKAGILKVNSENKRFFSNRILNFYVRLTIIFFIL
jgi:hypothetical protein